MIFKLTINDFEYITVKYNVIRNIHVKKITPKYRFFNTRNYQS